MKKTDIQTDDTVYVCGEGNADYSDRYAAVIIDTRDWEFTWESRRGYGPAVGVRLANSQFSRRDGIGMLAVRQGSARMDTSVDDFVPADLLKVTADAREALLLGATPELPKGYTIAMIRPQGVRDTWEQHVEFVKAQRKARKEADKQAGVRREADRAAARRLNEILGKAPSDYFYTPESAAEIEKMMEAYHQAKLAQAGPVVDEMDLDV